MAKVDFLASNDDAFATQMQTFKTAIPAHATALGVSSAQVAAQAADADRFTYELACHALMRNGAQQWTAWKALSRSGGGAPTSGAPVAPVFPAAVPPVAPGIEGRFRALVKQIKANANYNAAIGAALGVEGAEQSAPDLASLRPEIDAKVSGNRVEIAWGWGGHSAHLDMLELQVDRGDGRGFLPLAFDTTPGYVDTQPFPAAPTRWTYKAIYHVGDAAVGHWSLPVNVVVGSL